MTGLRLPNGTPDPWPPPCGAYWKSERRGDSHEVCFYGMTPNGLLCCLANHTVVEDSNGVITVIPSIKVTQYDKSWHGHLENGVWREAE